MTDKVQKIREEVVEIVNSINPFIPDEDGKNSGYEAGKLDAATQILQIIDSLEEPVSNPIDFENELYKAFGQVKDFTLGMRIAKWFYDMGKNNQEHVSEDLEEAAKSYSNNLDNICGSIGKQTRNAFKAGAKWKEQQFEKNRLSACDKQTEEEAEVERDFVTGIIEKEHRQPTFDDAIKYGMRLQKAKMMTKAIDGVITFDYYGNDNNIYGCIAHNSFCLEDIGLKDREKVKMIIVKDEMS